MKTKLKRRLIIFLALLLGAFIALNAVAYRQSYAMLHFTADNVGTEKPENLASAKKSGPFSLASNCRVQEKKVTKSEIPVILPLFLVVRLYVWDTI